MGYRLGLRLMRALLGLYLLGCLGVDLWIFWHGRAFWRFSSCFGLYLVGLLV
jgi:hypothetical protein